MVDKIILKIKFRTKKEQDAPFLLTHTAKHP